MLKIVFLIFLPVVTVLIAMLVEVAIQRQRRCSWESFSFNIAYTVILVSLKTLLGPGVETLTIFLTNHFGGGWIVLPDNGYGLLWAMPVFFLFTDFSEYAFHRAQHASPLLWSMHSLHHSDEEMNVTTTFRHFWLDFILKAFSIGLLGGLLFKVGPFMLMAYGVFTLWNFIPHTNVPVSLGRYWFLLNTSCYHRIHHSVEKRHWNRNFAAIFPVFDVIFGTYYIPAPEEWPQTGIGEGETPQTLQQTLIWPLRQHRWFRNSRVFAGRIGEGKAVLLRE